MKIYENVGFLNANNLHKLIYDYDANTGKNISVVMICIDEEMLRDIDLDKIEKVLNKLPCITVGILKGKVGDKSLALASMLHMRIAIKGLDIIYTNFSEFMRNNKIVPLLNNNAKNIFKDFHSLEKNENLLLQIGFISKIFDDLECDEFKRWLKTLFFNKGKEQLLAIKKCYDWYRNIIPKTNNRGILTMEESRQFCLLTVDKYKELEI